MKAARKPKVKSEKVLELTATVGETEAQVMARAVLRPSITAAVTLHEVHAQDFPELSLDSLITELVDQAKTVSAGNMARLESMLTAQAHTLDALFNKLTRCGVKNIGHYPEAVDRYMRLALRTQAQARATVETLHEMKHPKPLAFVQQANIAHGPQQVNNGQATRTEEIQKAQNELLEHAHGERLDGCTPRATTATDTGLETVGAVHRAENRTR